MTVDGLPWLGALACVLIVYLGATVQASLGIGMGMMSSPVLAIVDADFIPVAIILSVIPLSASVAWSERHHIDRKGAGLLMLGRIPGVIVGVLVVSMFSDTTLGLFVAGSVLIAVVVSLLGRKFVAGDKTLMLAGAASGCMATATGVGGPPIALTYQHDTPETMRATISTFFAVGAVMSFVGLLIAGEVSRRPLELTLVLLPAVGLGVLTSRRIHHRLDPSIVRPAVLALCAVNAIALLLGTVF